ncbi:DUF47 domain-containing protein [uncultured Clostridium sp.]|uniref:DUF47 domain-containing protein n=1 Tax=uncultured Clostridium sp. TaxID=59620 RepID=UPI0026056B5C|nr:DUF47 family protein [uncultured Clostridium sp.]
MFNKDTKEDKFYKLFRAQAENVLDGAKLLRKFLNTMENDSVFIKEMESLEHKGDKIVHEVIEKLNNAYVTPIDREDIFAITKKMDDCIDCNDSIMNTFVMFNVKECTEEAKQFGDFIVKAAEKVLELMDVLPNMAKSKEKKIINSKVIEVNRIENEADELFRDAVGKLFRDKNSDILDIIKWKDLYQAFENSVDSFEKIVNITAGVVMKNS